MKALPFFLLSFAIVVATVVPTSAADDKQLVNTRGDVSYQSANGTPKPVALDASVAIADNDYAITGVNSQAAIKLPDSSRVLVGQSTKVQMAFFDQQPNITNAKFILYQGKTRFTVEHPGGAKANYTFQTNTGQIAVRGTEGDISVSDTQLQVNVYALTDQKLPVVVTLNNGKVYTLFAGQALVVGIAGAAIAAATVSAVTQPLQQTFVEFGPAQTATVAAAGVAPAALAIGAGAVLAGAVIAGATHTSPNSPQTQPINPTPTPTASPTPTPPPGAVTTKPQSIEFPRPESTTLEAFQPNGDGQFTAQSSSSRISVTPSASNRFTVTATGAVEPGSASITITGDGGQPAVVPVSAASGVIQYKGQKGLTVAIGGTPAMITVSESGYTGTFTATAGSSVVSISAGGSSRSKGTTSSGTFIVTGESVGSTTITISDKYNNTPVTININVASGTIIAPSKLTLTKFNSPQPFKVSENGFTGTFNASSDNPQIQVTGQSKQIFYVTAAANGSATIKVSDGLGDSGASVSVTVMTPSPSPQPSTTCVPIIINDRHDGDRHDGDRHDRAHRHDPAGSATSCPSSAPSTGAPAPRGTVAPPKPHPVGPPPPFATPPPHKTVPQHTAPPAQPHQPMQPMGGMPGGQTPPPLPPPPPGNKR